MHPVLLRIGPLTLYSYGAMMAIAFLTASYLTGLELDRRGYKGELASTMVIWAAVGGLAGARILSTLNEWQRFLREPLAFLFSGAGFAWYGGLVGGLIAASWFIRRHSLPWAVVVDCAAPALTLGHAIGRIGCELAGDGDWGLPSTLPWAHSYPRAIIGWTEWTQAAGYPPDIRVHPTPLYEAVAYTLVFAVLWSLRKRQLPPGSLFWLYLLLAPGLRILIEFVRINPPVLWGLSQAQLISAALMALGAWKLAQGFRAAAAADHRPVRAADQ